MRKIPPGHWWVIVLIAFSLYSSCIHDFGNAAVFACTAVVIAIVRECAKWIVEEIKRV
jgi:hypothetical protein